MRSRSWQDTGLAALIALVIFALSPRAWSAATPVPDPFLPSLGQSVSAELSGNDALRVYAPATSYSRSGDTFTIDYELVLESFGPMNPELGDIGVPLGEIAPGNYKLVARFFNMGQMSAPAYVATSSLPVVPPQQLGVYIVPQQPGAYEPIDLVVRSAAYFDPSSLRATVSGTTVRVDFSYDQNAPVTQEPDGPPGMTSFASVRIAGLAPGSYRVEAWGWPISGGEATLSFTSSLTVASASPVVEFYAPTLGHYFMSAGPQEVAALDSGAQPGWQRTGWQFKAWLYPEDAPPQAQPVCRFYATGPNSHFYTADPGECAWLRAIEQSSRAALDGAPFAGWSYEGTAFWALAPQNGQCPAGTLPVYRAYNDRAAQDDSNHRFMVDARVRAAMLVSWVDEGIAFCSPQ